MPSGRVFNFADSENNYFAVMEKSELIFNIQVRCLNKGIAFLLRF